MFPAGKVTRILGYFPCGWKLPLQTLSSKEIRAI